MLRYKSEKTPFCGHGSISVASDLAVQITHLFEVLIDNFMLAEWLELRSILWKLPQHIVVIERDQMQTILRYIQACSVLLFFLASILPWILLFIIFDWLVASRTSQSSWHDRRVTSQTHLGCQLPTCLLTGFNHSDGILLTVGFDIAKERESLAQDVLAWPKVIAHVQFLTAKVIALLLVRVLGLLQGPWVFDFSLPTHYDIKAVSILR